jgi:uncharacterized protein (DUF1501 family)
MCDAKKRAGGCAEYRRLTRSSTRGGVSRRRFLGALGGGLTALAVPGWVPRVVLAQSENSARDVMVSIFLRGGCDALSMVVPHGEDAYYQLRPTLAVPRPDSGSPDAAVDLDGFFGLAPTLAPLAELYQDGQLLVVHACGLEKQSRSHFDAMHYLEVGQIEPPAELFTGWLGRHLATTAATVPEALLRAVGIGFGLQRTLVGGPQTLPIDDLATFNLDGDPATTAERRAVLGDLYGAVDDPLKTSAQTSLATIELLKTIDFEGYQPGGGAAYPAGEFGEALRSTAALIKAEVGVEAVAIDFGGWDTHDDQGPLDGAMAQLMTVLGEGLLAFQQDLAAASGFATRVTTTVMSEFGRNAFENGSGGTDHGHGNMMLVLGPGIAGGQVLTQWPGLAAGQLYEGQDLAITIDYRDILTEIVTERLGNLDFRNVFPDPDYIPVTYGVTV